MPPATPRPAALRDRIPEGGLADSEAILDRFLDYVTAQGLEPYPAQLDALLELASGRHVVLSTPTGSGKSLVALGLHFTAMCKGRRSFYTAPIKALVSEKFFALCDEFGAENVGMLTGDASINWAAPIICCTAEVLSNMALRSREQTDAPYVVMDEFHYYGDRDRGVAWQVPLLVLRKSRFLLMSATLGNTASIEEQLAARTGREVAHVHSDERPVPLDFAYRETPLHETVEDLLAEKRAPVYVVQFTQREAATQAQALTSAKIAGRDEKRAIAAAIGGFRFDSPYGKDMRRFLTNGVGLHHAGLLPRYKLLVERLAQQGLLKVICGTDTLGVGVNIPIRTVLFTRLYKFDGEKTGILSVREFKQISGRAGRRGFDDRGSVVCQAPEHVIENKRLAARSAGGKRATKKKQKKPPARGFIPWNADTFQRLQTQPPETLRSAFRVSHGMLVSCLQAADGAKDGGAGYRHLAELIALSHGTPARKRRLRREAAVLFRSLRRAEIVRVERASAGQSPRLRVDADLQRDFSLHQTLSLYLVEAVASLDRESPDYTLDLLSCVEAILEDPRPILYQQERALRQELLGRLKAEGVPYEERIAKLDEVTWPKPCADFLYQTFALFSANHPWVASESVKPKSIAREMFAQYASFEDTVKRYDLARIEGLLLRYLGQVLNALARSVPESARTDEVVEVIAYLRTMLTRVDSSLAEEWAELVSPSRAPEPSESTAPPRKRSLADDPRALAARVRAELHALVRALAAKRYDDAVACVRPDPDDSWDAKRLEDALAPFYDEYDRIVFEPRARQPKLTLLKPRGPGRFDAHQVLVDDAGDDLWNVECEIDLEAGEESDVPLIQIRRIGT